MPKYSIHIRNENVKKWESLTEKSAWINNILSSWSIKDIEKLKKENSYSRLERRVAKLESILEGKE
tara:strand:- start:2412 stop:2609 length:198 start_codon:yes stop_codon:yes gene_type:complete